MKKKVFMDISNNVIRRKLAGNDGFSLTELVATIALIGLLGTMVVALIPAIRNVMNSITMVSRSELLLSNTVTVLRDYLRYSDTPTVNENKCKFTGGDNWIYEISRDEANHGWITITPIVKTGDTVSALEIDSSSRVQDWRILTGNAASDNLIPTFDTISYSDGVFTISGLKVLTIENGTEKVKAFYKGEDRNAKDLVIRTLNS